MVAPVAIHQATESQSHGSEVLLEGSVVGPGSRVFVDDHLLAPTFHPCVVLPGALIESCAYQTPELFLQTERVRPDPFRQPHHARLAVVLMRGGRTDVDAHRPHLLVLRIATLRRLRVRVTVWCTSSPGPVDPGHVEVDVVGHRDLRIVLGDPVFRPVIRPTLSSFLT